MESLVSLRNMLILAALAFASLAGVAERQWTLWKTEAADKVKYDALADTNKQNDAITQDVAAKLTACIGKATASDKAATDAALARDEAMAKLQKAQKAQSIQRSKVYATPDCKQIMDSGICPAVSSSLRPATHP